MRVLVTGASSGIGEATARLLAAKGAEVGLVSEQEAQLQEVVCSLQQQGAKAVGFVANFAQPEQVTGLIAKVEAQLGPLEVLINNAGVGLGASALETTDKDLRFLFEINFFALVTLCREGLESMVKRGKGHIINVSSGSARLGLPGVSARTT